MCTQRNPRLLHSDWFSPNRTGKKQTSAATARLTKKWICKALSKASVCINTKPSLSGRANASLLARWFQSNYVPEISKYVMYGLESCRRLLIKYAKLYLSTEVWICSGVQSSNHTKGGGMFPWNLPSHCNSSFPPLSNYCWPAICNTEKQCWIPAWAKSQSALHLHSVYHKLWATPFEYEYEYVKFCNHYLVLNSHLDSLLLRPPFWIFNPKSQPWACQRMRARVQPREQTRAQIHLRRHVIVVINLTCLSLVSLYGWLLLLLTPHHCTKVL